MMRLVERKVKYGPAFWPLLNNGEHITLDVVEDGRRQATALTGVDRRAARLSGERRGYFACFAAEDRPDAVGLLAAGMAEWQRGQGMRSLFGPVAPDGSGFGMGVQVAGFERPSALLNPENPAHYDALLTAVGFHAETNWLSYELTMDALRGRRYPEAADWARRRSGIAVAAADPLRSRRDCERLWRAMGITDRICMDEFADQLARLTPWLDPRLTLVASRDGAPCGMLLGLRDRKTGAVRIATAHIDGHARRAGALVCLIGGMLQGLEAVRPTRLTAGVIDSENAASLAVARGAGGTLAQVFRQYTLLC